MKEGRKEGRKGKRGTMSASGSLGLDFIVLVGYSSAGMAYAVPPPPTAAYEYKYSSMIQTIRFKGKEGTTFQRLRGPTQLPLFLPVGEELWQGGREDTGGTWGKSGREEGRGDGRSNGGPEPGFRDSIRRSGSAG
ncbi:hypothetical protein C7212DRAFT_366906 [Tuber magnatum]|uniref:Uncharacterized protein n=1 Tax=Tuber magnatum TaxID=42249 RepID=A0A317SD91_9PEZI|nr:hypothetical protein C7212DRAFT_366906 [Tuber magnatum]